ncbi:K02A2.6-like [Cordylochernes scorpioides]|uniref:K02A2.6-like n=1 Tax=Cordylochernes scorpioides TaxID=51811 RepID=A0ABY6KEG5_9ARAC|nr:K02A2.6-like [Cordylochernes scorpioides]
MPPSTISEWTWPEKPWHRLHMDLAGPFMGRMFLVIVDAYTKWLEIFILKEITSRTIIYHLRQVFARFGLPELLVTDNGRQFVSKEFEEFTKMNGIRHTKTSPYNPSTNGLAERYVREFKTSLRKNSGKDSLETNLERFLLAQRAFPQTVMKESPAELLMKRRLKTRFSNLMPKMEFKGEAFHDALKKQENFSIGSDVYFRNYAAGPKWKQGTILKLFSCRHYLIGYEDQSFKRHINQLRPAKEKPEAAVRKDPRTISRRLVANGLHSCRPLRRLPLTPPNRRQRLEWCRARSTWMTEWHRVVFSDESRFCLSSDSRRVRVWRRRGERSNPAAIVERPTVRQRGIMVWGAIAYDSRSPLLRIQGTMTAQRYVDDVLRPVTLPYLQGVPNALYQQDNARPHTARISQQALQDVQMLPWPPYSPDLSPIEHVWDIIGRRLHALPQPRSEDELCQMKMGIAVKIHRSHSLNSGNFKG